VVTSDAGCDASETHCASHARGANHFRVVNHAQRGGYSIGDHATHGYTRCQARRYRASLARNCSKGIHNPRTHSNRNARLWDLPRNWWLRSAQVSQVPLPNAVAGAERTSCTSVNFSGLESIRPLGQNNGLGQPDHAQVEWCGRLEAVDPLCWSAGSGTKSSPAPGVTVILPAGAGRRWFSRWRPRRPPAGHVEEFRSVRQAISRAWASLAEERLDSGRRHSADPYRNVSTTLR
jgi:hypothetical protein